MEPQADELGTVFEKVHGFAQDADLPEALVFQIKLILEEMALNVINYGNKGGTEPIDIRLASDRETIVVEITDRGQPFDPHHDAPTPDLELSLEERPIGGLGLYLVKTMVDEMHYRWEDGRNKLTLITRILA
jgi:anti-sigma regulatory factor (Ser/Thr protein kinase)